MDENLKKQFDELCGEFGIGAEAAINIFAQTFVREQKMPSEIFTENIL